MIGLLLTYEWRSSSLSETCRVGELFLRSDNDSAEAVLAGGMARLAYVGEFAHPLSLFIVAATSSIASHTTRCGGFMTNT